MALTTLIVLCNLFLQFELTVHVTVPFCGTGILDARGVFTPNTHSLLNFRMEQTYEVFLPALLLSQKT